MCDNNHNNINHTKKVTKEKQVGVGYKAVGLERTADTVPGMNVSEYASGGSITVLMMTHVLQHLPAAQHHAWVCSAASNGYCAVKEMLQNGIPGYTVLIESGDLRDVDASGEGCCLLTYSLEVSNAGEISIPSDVRHVAVYGNITRIPTSFLKNCTGLTSLDLSPLSQVTKVQWGFLHGCTGLTALDLSPLSQVTKVQGVFLQGCTGINDVNNPPPLCDAPDGWSEAANQWARK